MKSIFKITNISLLLAGSGLILIPTLLHAKDSQSIESITVYGAAKKKTATESKGRKKLNTEIINNNKDLVRYSTDVGLSDSGRNQKGFALRGVEGNRVHISFDGVEIPNSEENSLYARYGNFNSSRIQIDPELARSVEFVKSSDSFNAGSGSLGGSVNYRSLRVSDIMLKGDKFGGIVRSGYSSKNKEWYTTLGMGYVHKKFNIMALISQRKGHETESRGSGEYTHGSKSQHPDPSFHKNKNYLIAANYHISPEHHLGFKLTRQDADAFTNERSYALIPSAWREANDVSILDTANMYYEWTPLDAPITSLKARYDYQKSDLGAVSHKGSLNWKTDEPELDEIFDRRYSTKFNRLLLSTEFIPIETDHWGEHTVSLQASASRRDFQSLNIDTIGLSSSWGSSTDRTTIQYPTRTQQYSFSLKTDSLWNEIVSSQWGLRYDYTQIKTKELNAPCSDACLAEGRPDGNNFSNWSGFIGLDTKLNDTWKIAYRVGTGYRVPTASELYFSFKNSYGTWQSNRFLQAEKSINHTFSLQADNRIGSLNLSLYHNRYRDFLLETTTLIEETKYGKTWQTPVNQMVNIDKAKISGLELGGKLFLDQISPLPKGFVLSGSLGYSKGSLSNHASLLSIQPLKAIIGLDYIAPSDKWAVFSRLSYLGGKKAKDAQVDEVKDRCLEEEFDWWYGTTICKKIEQYKELEDYKYLNKPSFVFDVFAYYKPTKRFTIHAGIYNVFNRKYHTWDALRGINSASTTNSVDRDGLGLQRFYAPGRNYSLSLEYKF